jgi:hypothetical protein
MTGIQATPRPRPRPARARNHSVRRTVCSPARGRRLAVARYRRGSSPLISPESMREISSRSAWRRRCTTVTISCNTAISRSGTHSCTLPRAMPNKFRRSGTVNRSFPSARFVAIERSRRIETCPTSGKLPVSRRRYRHQPDGAPLGTVRCRPQIVPVPLACNIPPRRFSVRTPGPTERWQESGLVVRRVLRLPAKQPPRGQGVSKSAQLRQRRRTAS